MFIVPAPNISAGGSKTSLLHLLNRLHHHDNLVERFHLLGFLGPLQRNKRLVYIDSVKCLESNSIFIVPTPNISAGAPKTSLLHLIDRLHHRDNLVERLHRLGLLVDGLEIRGDVEQSS